MDDSLLNILLMTWIVTASVMVVTWFIQRRIKNGAVVDVAWCLCFAFVAIGYAVITHGDITRRCLVGGMAAIWGFRLAGYILVDRILGQPEDSRYAMLRQWSGRWAQSFLFLIYQVEAFGLPFFSVALLLLMQNPDPVIRWWEWLGMLVWMISMIGEWTADWQLAKFRSQPHNHEAILQQGLWKYSRHPNYFFESIHWWAYVVMAVGLPFWWMTVLGPVMMMVTLLWVTGIPFAEAASVRRRGEPYREYQRTTSAFIPWLPKNKRYNR